MANQRVLCTPGAAVVAQDQAGLALAKLRIPALTLGAGAEPRTCTLAGACTVPLFHMHAPWYLHISESAHGSTVGIATLEALSPKFGIVSEQISHGVVVCLSVRRCVLCCVVLCCNVVFASRPAADSAGDSSGQTTPAWHQMLCLLLCHTGIIIMTLCRPGSAVSNDFRQGEPRAPSKLWPRNGWKPPFTFAISSSTLACQ